MEYFKALADLLKLEREEDRLAFAKLIESSSVAERRANGLTWYPVAIRGSEMTRGDYLTVEAERTTHHEIPHQLRFGVPAVLFSNHDAKQYRAEGVIAYQSSNLLRITLQTDELPDWSRDGKLGVELLFDDTSYDEMMDALRQASAQYEKGKDIRLLQVLLGEKQASFDTTAPIINERLNPSQRNAVEKIVAANELAIVHGPPGTGKTTTLVQAIRALIKKDGGPILVTAPSNTAVDLLSEKLTDEGLNVLRIGNPVRVSEKLMSLTLDSRIASHSAMKEVKNLRKQANEYRALAHKYKRNFGKAERDQRKALFDEAHKILREISSIEQYVTDDLTGKAQVIAATLVGTDHYTVRKMRYHTVVIDEAGQSLEPACWIPILKAKKVILAGDHYQLPPTVKSYTAGRNGLQETLLEKTIIAQPEAVILLEEQYRMHETIMGFSGKMFYDNRLRANAAVKDRLLLADDLPFEFVDTAGAGFEEKAEGTSTSNPEEAALLIKHLTTYALLLAPYYTAENFPSIAIISPYKQQVVLLRSLLEHATGLLPYAQQISVNTIDGFQGQERDIVYISLVRCNNEAEIGFLSDVRRMNVALTRARSKLVAIGDSGTLSVLPFYLELVNYAEQVGGYRSAWDFISL